MATINDIAKAAGVSVSTVSHVINKTKYVSPDLTEKVRRALEACDTPPIFVQKKRSLSKKNELVILTPSSSSHFQSIYRKLSALLNGKCSFSCYIYDEIYTDFRMLIKSYLLDRCFCVIVLCQGNCELLTVLEQESVPCIVIASQPINTGLPVIINDVESSYRKIANHLIRIGHNRIIYFYHSGHPEGKLILSVMDEVFSPITLPDNGFMAIEYTQGEELGDRMQKILVSQAAPLVILFDSAEVLENIFPFFYSTGFHYSDKISLIGFNLQNTTRLFCPPITTVDYNYDQLVCCIADFLAKFRDGCSIPQKTGIVPIIRHLSSIPNIIKDSNGVILPTIFDLNLSKLDKEALCQSKKLYTAAISFHYTGRAFMRLIENGMRSIFNSLNISLTAITDSACNPVLQKKQLEGLMAMDTNVIYTYPSDVEYLHDVYKSISAGSSKLIFMGQYLPDDFSFKEYCTQICCPEPTIAYLIAYSMGEYMIAHGLTTAAFIANDNEAFYNNAERCSLIVDILNDVFPSLKTILYKDSSASTVYDWTTELIESHPEIEIMYISWERPTISALKALEAAGRTDIALCTMDLDYEVALNMAANGPVKMIYGQPLFEIGQALAIAGALSLLKKRLPPLITFHTSVITRENLLESWKEIYKESPPSEIVEQFRNGHGLDINFR